jgi:methylthioribose-1-phosphate isomerase
MVLPLRYDDDTLRLLDQTRLPAEEVWLEIRTVAEMEEAIRSLRVRGAPAIGHAAAHAVLLALDADMGDPKAAARDAIARLRATRPTAVNLFYALDRMAAAVDAGPDDRTALRDHLRAEADALFAEDQAAGRAIGEHGLALLRDGETVMTICHTGGVATSGYGTAVAPLLVAAEHGLHLKAVACETRPLLQGARITAWELAKAGVDVTLITDSMAAAVMARGRVDAVFVGADRIAASGDTANKIGTYSLAVLARAHGIPFYVAAPVSTVDLATPDGTAIEIEQRDAREVTHGFGRQTAPEGVQVYNPAFDVTPAALITAIVTERGLIRPPFAAGLRRVVVGDDGKG